MTSPPDARDRDRKALGRWGESVAATFLEGQGYVVLERNWRCARGEIDLITQAGQDVVFVEVKTRRGRQMGTPEEALTEKKSRKLLTLAQTYLAERDMDVNWRIDLVAVELDTQGRVVRCDHIPNAVMAWYE